MSYLDFSPGQRVRLTTDTVPFDDRTRIVLTAGTIVEFLGVDQKDPQGRSNVDARVARIKLGDDVYVVDPNDLEAVAD